jgi:hypothetical protein
MSKKAYIGYLEVYIDTNLLTNQIKNTYVLVIVLINISDIEIWISKGKLFCLSIV